MLTQNLNVRADNKGIVPIVHMVQGDSGRRVTCILQDYDIPSGSSASLSVERPDGNVYIASATISNNNVSATITSTMLNVVGNAKATMHITTSGSVVSTFEFVIKVEEAAGFAVAPSPADNSVYVYVNGNQVKVLTGADLADYYKKTETYSAAEIDDKIAEATPEDYDEVKAEVSSLSESTIEISDDVTKVERCLLRKIDSPSATTSGYYRVLTNALETTKKYAIEIVTSSTKELSLKFGSAMSLSSMVDTVESNRVFSERPISFSYNPTGNWAYARVADVDNNTVQFSMNIYEIIDIENAEVLSNQAYEKATALETEVNKIASLEQTSQMFNKNETPSHLYVKTDKSVVNNNISTTWVINAEQNKRYVIYATEDLPSSAALCVSTFTVLPQAGTSAKRALTITIHSKNARELILDSEEKYILLDIRDYVATAENYIGVEQIDSGFDYENEPFGTKIVLLTEVNSDNISEKTAKEIVAKANVRIDSKWKDKTIWWCGTSIPAGSDTALNSPSNGKAYPILVGELLGANVINTSLGSSMCRANTRHGDYTNAMSHNIIRCLSQTAEEKEDMISNWSTYRLRLNDPNTFVTLSDSDKRDAREATFDATLMPYLDGTHPMPDLFVFDHGHNDWKTFYTDSTGKPDTCLEPTVANISSGELAEDTYMTSNSNAKLISYFGEVDKIPANKRAEFIASVNRNCFKGAINFLVTLILSKNPRARILFIGNLDNWEKPQVQQAQIDVSESWEFPLIKVWEKTGFSGHYIPNTSKLWDASGTQDLDMKRVYCKDGVHPHSDTTGMAMKNYSEIIADGINHIVV